MPKMKAVVTYPEEKGKVEMIEIEQPEINEKWPGFAERLITRRVPFEKFDQALEQKPTDI